MPARHDSEVIQSEPRHSKFHFNLTIMTELIQEANAQGLEILATLLGSESDERTRFEGKALNPAVLVSLTCK